MTDHPPINVYINSFNRLTWLRDLVHEVCRLEGLGRIVIVDNASTYEPLLAWLEEMQVEDNDVKVVHRGSNGGPRGAFREAYQDPAPFYVVTDPDMDLSECPDNLLYVLREGLLANPDMTKTGPSIRIDDIPDANPFKQRILEIEAPFWKTRRNDWWYEAETDTTFALYRRGEPFRYGPSLRAPAPYRVRHMTNYYTQGTLTAEDWYYVNNLPPMHKSGLYWSTLIQDNSSLFYVPPPASPA